MTNFFLIFFGDQFLIKSRVKIKANHRKTKTKRNANKDTSDTTGQQYACPGLIFKHRQANRLGVEIRGLGGRCDAVQSFGNGYSTKKQSTYPDHPCRGSKHTWLGVSRTD